ncbi:peptidase T [Apibacter adventoris]|uniref:Peptidase T n=1 Tax=Apibacter adventoris TaxID=1679466 RepID=A0A2S8A898_9FLAO|nr:peptidase T [Apibacter adventoris]PQL90792.1 peptidase T [Apibacter adventoris]
MQTILSNEWQEKLLKRFLKYISFHSTSKPGIDTIPSTEKQWNIAKYLYEELKNIGVEDVSIDKNGYVMGNIPSNKDKSIPTVGFIAHYDTSPDFSGENVKPKIWENYDGSDLLLNSETNFILKVSEFPELKNHIGETLITTDGTTLLGSDDKSGVAEIVTAAEYLISHPEIKHGKIAIGFTPDEEVGKGADLFDVKKFNADWAYTMDGGEVGELEFENFNAGGATISIIGKSVHPGSAKGKMINAALLAVEFSNQMPHKETPSTTEGYEGFYHLTHISGSVEKAKLQYIIRDHDFKKYENRKAFMIETAEKLNKKYGEGVFHIEITDQYFNMKKQIENKMFIIDIAEKAMEKAKIKANIKAIRGGTDGARLSYMGLPCPNIFAGGLNFHGPYEFVPLESMIKATEVILNIAESIE